MKLSVGDQGVSSALGEYCYEWNSLGDGARISLDGWRRIIGAIRSYHLTLGRRLGEPVEARVIWHGGEPLTLAPAYLDAAMSLQHQLLDDLRHSILLQTNLYRLPASTLDVLLRHRVKLGVSMDVFGGVRRDVRGVETEGAVVANMDDLDRRGIKYGAITVVARQNYRRLNDARLARRGFQCCRSSTARPNGRRDDSSCRTPSWSMR